VTHATTPSPVLPDRQASPNVSPLGCSAWTPFGMSYHDVTTAHCPHLPDHPQPRSNRVLADSSRGDYLLRDRRAHTDDFPLSAATSFRPISAPHQAVIHLGSAGTVLISDDPVRVFQRDSPLRRQRRPGRGQSRTSSSIDSFPLFGSTSPTTSSCSGEGPSCSPRFLKGVARSPGRGKTRAPLHDQIRTHTEFGGPFPPPGSWSRQPHRSSAAAPRGSVLRIASRKNEFIGGSPARFAPFSHLFFQVLWPSSDPACRSRALTAPGHVAYITDEKARDEFLALLPSRLPQRRQDPRFANPDQESFLIGRGGRTGALYVVSPETVAQKIATESGHSWREPFD